ncbi:MAG: VIT and VWA domain-containing protein [Acidobacteria bacterium]|nr:VIT and VWA domain-containing protein [Acidobacteriota bacterium]
MTFIRIVLILCGLSRLVLPAFGDAGVLIPSSESDKPDATKLSLGDMQVSILVDNQNARVSVRQIFASHVGSVLEGQYLFGINPEALVSDFGVWDGAVRIPGVILERKRAEEIYNALRLQAIDPGLLQQAEQGEEGGSRVSFFSARITPIPAYGTKRLELEYTERLPLERLQSYFYFPLKPRQFQNQAAGRLRINLTVRHVLPMANFKQTSVAFPLVIDSQTANEIRAHYEGSNVTFADDFVFTYELRSPSNLSVLFYRSKDDRHVRAGLPITAFERPGRGGEVAEPGYFQASALFNIAPASVAKRAFSSFVLLFDTSLSIRWDKLERQYEALEKILYHLQPSDRVQLLLFNSKVTSFRPTAVNASRENIAAALDLVKQSYLVGGTNLKQALQTVLDQYQSQSGFSGRAVLISDGNPTLGTLETKTLARWFASANTTTGGPKLKLYAYGIGTDCNKILLRDLAQSSGGLFEFVGETEATEFKLNNFVNHLTLDPLVDPRLEISSSENFSQIYRSPEDPVFDQSLAHWVGKYRQPLRSVIFTASARQPSGQAEIKRSIDLPTDAVEHLFIPRNWAKARVDFLLRKIEMAGEDAESIKEVIQLSKKYKFVTPYTSFLAAPRSLLRPRLIKPGDPILRVRTDPDIRSITAIFPFGLIKRLRYLPREQVWQTRFLAPKEMVDGVYHCRLILRDEAGRVYEEKKSFVIDSRSPTIQARIDRATYRAGDTVQIRVQSDADTRRIRLRVANLEPGEARWDPQGKASVGHIVLPPEMATGQYALEIFAEDFAHNVSSSQVMIAVVGP